MRKPTPPAPTPPAPTPPVDVPRKPFVRPEVVEHPDLTELTLQSPALDS